LKSPDYNQTKKRICDQQVGGSNPSVGSKKKKGVDPIGSIPFLLSNEQAFDFSIIKIILHH
jgi:hypothetical protein